MLESSRTFDIVWGSVTATICFALGACFAPGDGFAVADGFAFGAGFGLCRAV